MNRLIIIGASGHGKVVADVAKRIYQDIVFLDNNSNIKSCAGYSVLGPDTMTPKIDGDVFIAIGKSDIRKRLMEKYNDRTFPVLIHPAAVIAENVVIGEGTAIMAGAVINPGAIVGKGCIVNTCSSVDHDCVIGDFCHISVGSHLSGTVVVGENTYVGAGVTIGNNVNICSGCMIGAGAVVVKNIEEKATYVGVPAKKMAEKAEKVLDNNLDLEKSGGYSATK